MKLLKWIIGTVLILAFVYFNFFILEASFIIKLINFLLFCSLFILYRVFAGPTAADRIVAVEIMGVLIVGLTAIIGLFYNESFFMDIGLVWALLSFIASLAFAKILEGRQLND
jgi:multicomponent Na+:H+ antiporter subunit F